MSPIRHNPGGQSGNGQQPGSEPPADSDATTVYRPGDYGVSGPGGSAPSGSAGGSAGKARQASMMAR